MLKAVNQCKGSSSNPKAFQFLFAIHGLFIVNMSNTLKYLTNVSTDNHLVTTSKGRKIFVKFYSIKVLSFPNPYKSYTPIEHLSEDLNPL